MKIIPQSIVYLACACAVLAQAPTGTIAGVARDPSGAAVGAAHVKLTSQAVGFDRTSVTSEQGDYSFPALLAGEYEVSIEASGFERVVCHAVVEAGTTTTIDFALRVGDVTESVSVDSATPQRHYDSHTVEMPAPSTLMSLRDISRATRFEKHFLSVWYKRPKSQAYCNGEAVLVSDRRNPETPGELVRTRAGLKDKG